MKKIELCLILLGAILVYVFIFNSNKKEDFGNYSSTCEPPELLEQVMKERKMNNDDNNYDMFIPCSYNECEQEILAFENSKTGKKLFFIDGCDVLASKLTLWDTLRNKYNKNASKYMPPTFLLENEEDMKEFPKFYAEMKKKNPEQMYILKNYGQRQEGLKLTKDLDEIMDGLKHGWYLVQEYIYDPFLISGHKINFRYYLLVICKNGKMEGYIHKDGFLYYTPKKYDTNDMDFGKHITTGYIDRKIYDENPLTLQNFRDYLDKINNGLSKVWDNNANKLMSGVMGALSTKICNNKKLDNHVRFQLFGCDLAPYSNLDCKLMEINKGPDLDAKDERDKQVKLKVQRDMMALIDPTDEEIENPPESRFVKIF
jgi:hypothetical protein